MFSFVPVSSSVLPKSQLPLQRGKEGENLNKFSTLLKI
jgi:hypothetical protein